MAAKSFSGGKALEDKLREIARKAGEAGTLKVGFLEGATYPDADSTPVAMVAAIQNFGAPAAGIPARPFFSNMVAEKRGGWGDALGKIAVATDYDMKTTLGQMGKGIKGQLQQAIKDTNSPALSPETIQRKGFPEPLVDTGRMLNSVNFEVSE